MKNREWYQFKGFLSTPPLWEDKEIFKLKQFSLPKVNFPESFDLVKELPTLQTNFVLGKRIEDFFSLIFERSYGYKILVQGLQIFQNKKTLGELDFILELPEEKKILHLEVVYKFYVYDPTIQGELARWIGPNRKDTLLRKLDKLEQKQLPLLAKEETVRALEELGVMTKTVEQQVSFLAHLFIPRNLDQKDFPQVNNRCLAGTWITREEFSMENFGINQYFIPPKQDWTIDPSWNEIWFSYEDILSVVRETLIKERSPLLWMRTPSGFFERFFIVWW